MLVSHENIVKILQDDYKAVLNANNNFAENAKEKNKKIAELEANLERKENVLLKPTEDNNYLKSKIEIIESANDKQRQTTYEILEKYKKLQDTLVFIIQQWEKENE